MVIYHGSGNSNILCSFHPETWGRCIHFDDPIFLDGLVQPPTSDRWERPLRVNNPLAIFVGLEILG